MTHWVASPYVHEVPYAPFSGRLPELRDASAPHVLYDLLNERIVVLAPAEYERVRALAVDDGASGTDDAREFRPDDDATDAFLVANELAFRADEVFRRHNYRNVEIEINRHCNFRCQFCPVSVDPKPRAFMTDDTFRLVLDRAVDYGVETISLNHYSEPSLCRDLVAKIARAGELGLGVRLYTNASLLTAEDIDGLAAAGNMVSLIVNLPTIDPDEYRRVTGTKFFATVATNVEHMARVGLPVRLSINAPFDERDATVARINERFESMLGTSVEWYPTTARAFWTHRPTRHRSKARAHCAGAASRSSRSASAGDGRVVLCCQDYYQDYVLGDLHEATLREIADSEYAISLRRDMFGGATPARSFICTRCEWTEGRGADPSALRVGSYAKDTFRADLPDCDAWVTEAADRELVLSPSVRASTA